jgi:PPOX class probable F420-dependent enzyme
LAVLFKADTVAARTVATVSSSHDNASSVMPDHVRTLLDGPNVAHLATLLPDGAPHNVPVWVDLEGDRVAFLTGPDSRKALNIERDPRVAISITDRDQPFTMATVQGRVTAVLDGDPAWEIIDRISQKYIGQPYEPRSGRVVFLVEPEHAWGQTLG